MGVDLLSRAETAHAQGDRAKARELLREMLAVDPRNEDAWWLLAQVVERRLHAIYCLRQLLTLNPQHQAARKYLSLLETRAKTAPDGNRQASQEKTVPKPSTAPDAEANIDSNLQLPDNQVISRIGGLFEELEQEAPPVVPVNLVDPQNGRQDDATSMVDAQVSLDHSSPTVPVVESGLSYCPYLGLRNDQETRTSFPSPLNRCFRSEKPLPIEFAYQAKYCLGSQHKQCRIYQAGLVDATALKIGNKTRPDTTLRNGKLWLIGAAVFAVGLIALAIVWLIR